jgi:hypothetical protein
MKRSTMALVAMILAVGWTGAAAASAATQSDTTVDDFLAGTPDGTYVGDSDAGAVDGEVVLDPEIAEEFEDGPGLPVGWSGTEWAAGGTFAVVDGSLVVNGARAGTTATYPPGRSLEFVATFSGGQFQNVGFGTDFNDAPWAMFSTGPTPTDPVGLYARTFVPGGAQQNTRLDTTLGIDPLLPHRYRIVWTATGVTYYVDDVEVAMHPAAPADLMRPLVSDFPVGGPAVSVQWLRMSPYGPAGTFTSRAFDAGDHRTFWQTLTADAVTSGGTTVSFETRTGNTPAPDASWSAWQPVGAAGAVASPFGRRYFQYRATLTTPDEMVTPVIRSVDVSYAVDTAAPLTSIGDVAVSGTTARVTFSSEAGARFECSLGNGPFQACTSPRDYTGLSAGAHVVRVRAIDQVGNVGPAAERSFVISSPPPPSPPNGDNSAPKVRPKPRSVSVTSRGRFTVRLRCPSDETRCFIMLRVRYRGETIASKRVIVLGGRTANVTLRVKPFARAALQSRRRLNVLAVTTARDAAGNRAMTSTAMTLRAAR